MARKGEGHHLAALTAEKVIRARELRSQGRSYNQILDELDHPCSRSTLYSAVTGATWKHVGEGGEEE